MSPSRRTMPHAVFHRGLLARVALTALVSLLVSAGAVGQTRDAAQTLPGKFDPHAALALAYGKLDTEGDVPLWTSPEYPDEPMRVRVLGALPFRQDGAERMFLLTELVPEIEGGFRCHPCAPGIGAATFTKTAAGWRLDVATPHVTDLGSYGEAPEPGIAKVGPQRYAVVFSSGGVGQGYHGGLATYLLETETGVNEALTVQTYSDNSGACDPDHDAAEEDREGGAGEPCWTYRSSLEFIPGRNAEYFDLKVTTTGPSEGDFHEETVYSVTDGTYRVTRERTVDYRLVAHPVSGVELPRIALASRPAVERAVNDQLDSLAGDMMCLPDAPDEDQSYESSAEVTYADNDVLSVAIHASFFCGGAHPVNDANLSVTFDLLTGRSVGFRELFEDYARDSAQIAEAYLATLSADDFEGCEDVLSVAGDDEELAEEDAGGLGMYGFAYTLSPRGLVVQPEFPHVIAACAVPSTLPFERVRSLASKEGILMRVADAAR